MPDDIIDLEAARARRAEAEPSRLGPVTDDGTTFHVIDGLEVVAVDMGDEVDFEIYLNRQAVQAWIAGLMAAEQELARRVGG